MLLLVGSAPAGGGCPKTEPCVQPSALLLHHSGVPPAGAKGVTPAFLGTPCIPDMLLAAGLSLAIKQSNNPLSPGGYCPATGCALPKAPATPLPASLPQRVPRLHPGGCVRVGTMLSAPCSLSLQHPRVTACFPAWPEPQGCGAGRCWGAGGGYTAHFTPKEGQW